MTTEKKRFLRKAPTTEPVTEATATSDTTTSVGTGEVVVETDKTCSNCGRAWSAPAPDSCPECGSAL